MQLTVHTPSDPAARAAPAPSGTPSPAPSALLLPARQAAALCGVSVATWHRMTSAGRCPPPLRLSAGCVRWRREDLESWISAGCPDRKTWELLRGPAQHNGRPR